MKLNSVIHKYVGTLLCVLSLSPARVFAGGTPKLLEETGIIKSVDLSAHTLVVTQPRKSVGQKFQWNEQTKFNERNQSTTETALKQGERVRFTYAPGGAMPTLQSIHITPAKTKKHSTSGA